MNLVELDEVSLKFGTQVIFQQTSLNLPPGERVCLIGRNGAGKSTLFRLILKQQQVDDGEVRFRSDLRVACLHQQMPAADDNATVKDIVAMGLSDLQQLLSEYDQVSQSDTPDTTRLHQLQQAIEAQNGWDIDVKVERIMSQLSLPAEHRLQDLSGGWQRRVMLGQALVSEPHLLLLDEPTNHLDIATIEWLEGHLLSCAASVLFITHDRSFLQRLATRIVELDRGQLWSWDSNYKDFVQAKAERLDAERSGNKEFDKKLAREEVWIRQGVKARGTRNQGRVRNLEDLRSTQAARLKPQGKVKLHIEESEPSGKTVIELKRVGHWFDDGQRKLLDHFSLKIRRGDRIGIIGNNGVGKTTLLRILLGQLQPAEGIVKLGTNLFPAFFDQMRETLNFDKSVAYNVADGKDYLPLKDKQVHVIGYLKNFLFSPEQAQTPLNALSGGEINRVLLAKICSRPSNLLVLDEPTNDLDLELLEVLEQAVHAYQGTLIVVSHDRQFLESAVSSVLVFGADDKIHHYKGGYQQWLAQGQALAVMDTPDQLQSSTTSTSKENTHAADTPTNARPKVSYKVQREYDLLPARIETLEQNIRDVQAAMEAEDFYTKDFDTIQPVLDQHQQLKDELEKRLARWLELEDIIEVASQK